MKLIVALALLSIASAQFNDFDIKDYKDVVNSRNFTGKVILVTGSNSGIGEGIVKLFSILGANVVVTGRKADDVQRVGKEVQELSPKKLKLSQELAYAPAKAGLDMLTRVLALELGPKGIRVNTLNPGATQVDKTGDPGVDKITPLRREGQPLDMAKGVAFLGSSDASFITGANLVVDGGLVYNMGALGM
ncbi:unnamed protein product [Oppiella nova]|uniref:Short-chain dehydrogenase n=1 Tax=Oppiella nova TaxID=334625 RepID=A0A7R9QND9_9ACAR|nr:unnamed protein product [Oppiella nova]CAG2169624.1 unnamed protein product [Oppiella nova]